MIALYILLAICIVAWFFWIRIEEKYDTSHEKTGLSIALGIPSIVTVLILIIWAPFVLTTNFRHNNFKIKYELKSTQYCTIWNLIDSGDLSIDNGSIKDHLLEIEYDINHKIKTHQRWKDNIVIGDFYSEKTANMTPLSKGVCGGEQI